MFKLFAAAAGLAGVMINKKGVYKNFAEQYLKYTETAYNKISPYLEPLIDEMCKISKSSRFNLADESIFLEKTLNYIVMKIAPDEIGLLNFALSSGSSIAAAEAYSLASSFCEKYNIK